VIRIRPETPDQRERRNWLGHVTNVFEQSERYVRDFDGLVAFIEESLVRMGIVPRSEGTEGRKHGQTEEVKHR
jgi:hypothetical protein